MSETNRRISSFTAASAFFLGDGACSGAVFRLVDSQFENALKHEERAAMPLAGGIMQHGFQCGQIWGATLAAGAQAYRLLGPGPQAETRAILAAQHLVRAFRERNEHINCLEITDIDQSSSKAKMFGHFLLRGGAIRCFRMVAGYAPVACDEIEDALARDDIEAPAATVGCTAVLAKRMGMSDLHATMAAGLAGGIGLSGGACGALGAAIWLQGLKFLQRDGGKLGFKNTRGLDTINRFLQCAKYEFECSEIVGRTFRDTADHADHLRRGGCSAIIETLAT